MGWTQVGTIATTSGSSGGGSGIPGQRGQDGATWLIGQNAPTPNQGNVGDFYFQTTQTGGGAILIPGPTGPQGPPGPAGNGGSGAASSVVNSIAQGRLTLTSGTAVTTSDVTSATTIYWTPYKGNQIALYSGGAWSLVSFSETSIALGTLASGKNYDVFACLSGGTLVLEFSSAWSSDTARNDALALQDGILVKSADHTRRYLGTFRTISTTATADSGGGVTTQTGGQRFLWNMYNRVQRFLSVFDATDSWVYNTATWRQANGAAGNKVEYVCGQSEDIVTADTLQNVDIVNAAVAYGGVGADSTTTRSGLASDNFNNSATIGQDNPARGSYTGIPGLGYHYLAWLERGGGSGTTTWTGDAGETGGRQSGLNAMVWA